MQQSLETYILSDQPCTCPKCGVRTEILADFYKTKNQTQIHQCPNDRCKFEFVLETAIN